MPERKPYSLQELVAQCDLSAPVPAELQAWEQAAPVGYEQAVLANQVDIREPILKFAEALSKEFDVVQLVMHGSRARGDYSAESDINMAVLLRGENEELREFVDVKLALACVFQTKVATDSSRSLPPIPRESCH
ncbi:MULTISPECIES: nucleotidyltransferase domain-containing protein [unclassified Marinobacter]|uniref:nucleotidyltransferase domain-containing protein n=1 Tax=unclassified Marinobacter TaxID=83889 RepID=UPI00200D0FA3|nr:MULTISPECIES: nucleotidyltransferase domain-containing protein [unclassified Marinobacter]UQG56576.1 nucleotidyltransferase domain-containing protein [Marinobacter sp. M4C]UQG65380.1 nucleotidyltransferase domain-containing protein [Marinobacter sp. M2C]UQG69659.1 nucleotidyltransferase domain-containing protein [Marinobacter sp. M1C]